MLPVLRKYAQEVRTITFDFSAKLAAGDSLTGTVTFGSSAGLTLTGPTVNTTLAQAYVHVSGGVVGNDYEVRCEVNTTNGDYLREVVTIEVRDDAN
jgi:hypothetical protein